MAGIFKIFGYGSASANRNVLRVLFDTALSSKPIFYAYDGGTYPAVGVSVVAPVKKVLAGTIGNGNISSFYLISTDTVGAPVAPWKPTTTAGSADANRMQGTTSYVTHAGAIPGAGQAARFNIGLEVDQAEFSTLDNPAEMAHDLVVSYTYTGTAPAPEWQGNDELTGDETTPTWTQISATPDTEGIRHCKTGTTIAGPFYATIPPAGVLDTTVGIVTDA